MRRRRFLLGSAAGARSHELSCETLYMRVADARADGSLRELLERLDGELAGVGRLRLHDSGWLLRHELDEPLRPLLDAFRARGGHLELG